MQSFEFGIARRRKSIPASEALYLWKGNAILEVPLHCYLVDEGETCNLLNEILGLSQILLQGSDHNRV